MANAISFIASNTFNRFTPMPYNLPDKTAFLDLASGHNLIPVFRKLTSDQLTPVLAYRRLVRPDDRMAPSFLLESVVGGDRAAMQVAREQQPIDRGDVAEHPRAAVAALGAADHGDRAGQHGERGGQGA